MKEHLMEYVAKLTREGSQWLIEFPDCPGCQTYGNSKAAALAMAAEALGAWLESQLEYGAAPPRKKYKAKTGVAVPVEVALALAIQLRWLREDRGLTQGGLAKIAGVTQQQIAKLERPNSNPTIKTIQALAVALGTKFQGSFA